MSWMNLASTPSSQWPSPLLRGELFRQRMLAVVDCRSPYNSVGAVVRWGVRRIIWATEAVVVNAADEMAPSGAKVPLVDVRHATCAFDVVCAQTTHVTSANVSHMASCKATYTAAKVTSAKAVHTEATAALGLCAGGKKAAGKHCACQNHHHSSSHDILH